jgi:hypothetical protein
MKRILMSLMVIGLVGGLMGAAMADFSDIEISEDNFFASGSLDLRVSDYLGNEYDDPNVPALVTYSDAWPCCTKDYYVDLHNAGQGNQFIPWAYLHLKNFECEGVEPAKGGMWIKCDPVTGECVITDENDPDAKCVTEPEYVAECGGVAGEDVNGNKVVVPGVGCDFGENCEMSKHIDIEIFWSTEQVKTATEVTTWTQLDLSQYDTNPANGIIKLNELECKQIELGQIPPCNKLWLDLRLHLQDIDEDDLIAWGVLTDPGTGYGWFDDTIPAEAKWDHWPTNALQLDKFIFDMSFELLQNKVP